MPPPAVTVSRGAAYDQDDEAPPDYRERQAQQQPPPPYRYPLRHWMLWLAFGGVLAGFCISSVGALAARFEAVKAGRDPHLSSSGEVEAMDETGRANGGSKGLRMWYLPAHLVDDMEDVHLAANALSMGASIVVLLQVMARAWVCRF